MGLLLRSNLRRRWASTLVLVLLVGLALGVTMASAIGARRTATAFPRLAEEVALPDLVLYVGETGARVADALRHQAQVRAAGVGTGVGLTHRLPDGSPDFERDSLGALVGDGTFGVTIERPLLIDGRLPAEDAPTEIMLDENASRTFELGVGDTFPGLTFDVDQIQEVASEVESAGREPTAADFARVFIPVDLEVVGVGRTSDAILVNEAVEGEPAGLLSPAYLDEHAEVASYTVAVVDVIDDRSVGAYVDAVRADLPGVDVGPTDQAGRESTFAAAVRPYVLSLAFFAVVLGVGAVLALGPALVRVVDEELADRGTMRALGAGRSQLIVAGAVRPLIIGSGGALVAAAVAVALSSRFPIGPAGIAEPSGGTELHLVGIAIGVVATVAAVALAAFGRGIALTRAAATRRPHPSSIVSGAGAAGLPPTALTGLHAAFAAGPDRSRRRLATAGIAGALAMAIGAVGFGAGLSRLVEDPQRFGWSWDVLFENYDTPLDGELAAGIRADDDVLGFVPISRGSITVDGRAVPAIGMDLETAGDVSPTVLDGRAPTAQGEIALGAVTARDLGVAVGDFVQGSAGGGGTLELEVVGTVVIPSIQLDETNQLGRGAFVTAADYDQLVGWFPSAALADVRPGTTLAELEERHFISALGVQRPGDVTSYGGVDDVPGVLALVLGALAVAVLVHLLMASVRQRRGELAVLRAIGLRPRQVASTVLWQTTAQVLAVLVVAVPLGVAAGRLSWRWFADGIGIAPDPSTPLVLLAVAVVVLIGLAALVAVVPARRAASVHPARALRAE